MGALENAVHLRSGLKAWFDSDCCFHGGDPVRNSRLRKAFRDNWYVRVGAEKFGRVWSIGAARRNRKHPASREALKIPRGSWSSQTVTVDHAIPVSVLFAHFWAAETRAAMQAVIDAYAVAVVTKEENGRLKAAELKASMPADWRFGDDPLARWNTVRIEVPGLTPFCPDWFRSRE